MWIFSQLFRRSSIKPRGFTLIEMLVVMSIMVVITATLLVQQSRFDSSTVLRSLAYGVALSVRQAQVYGTSVVGTSTSAVACTGGYYNILTGNCYTSAYGLYFSSATPTSYILFADLDNNGEWSAAETVKTFTFGSGYSLLGFGATTTGASPTYRNYSFTAGAGSISDLTIIFKRPNPDACIATSNSANACQTGATPGESYAAAYVQVQALSDPTNSKGVGISTTGEVSVCSLGSC